MGVLCLNDACGTSNGNWKVDFCASNDAFRSRVARLWAEIVFERRKKVENETSLFSAIGRWGAQEGSKTITPVQSRWGAVRWGWCIRREGGKKSDVRVQSKVEGWLISGKNQGSSGCILGTFAKLPRMSEATPPKHVRWRTR